MKDGAIGEIAGNANGTAHDDKFLDGARDGGVALERFGDVGQRAKGEYADRVVAILETGNEIIDGSFRFRLPACYRERDTGKVVRNLAPLSGEFRVAFERRGPAGEYRNILASTQIEQPDDISRARVNMRQAVCRGDGFATERGMRQQESDGHQIIRAGVRVDDERSVHLSG